MACNFLDEQNGSKTDFNNDLYQSIDSDGYNVSYICMSCRPFFLNSVKIEHDYRKAQTMFEEKQESVINHSGLSDCATPTKPPKEMDHSIPTSSFNLDIHVPGGEIYELPMTSKFNAGIFTQCLL